MAGKIFSFNATELEVEFFEREIRRTNSNPTKIIRQLIQDAMKEKKKLEEIEGIKEVIRKSQGTTKDLVEQIVMDVAAMRFEIGCLSEDKMGEKKAKEIKEAADKLGEEKLADLVKIKMEEIQ